MKSMGGKKPKKKTSSRLTKNLFDIIVIDSHGKAREWEARL